MRKYLPCILIMFMLVACRADVSQPVEPEDESYRNGTVSAIRMINIDGEMYYDTKITDYTPRCGNFDGTLLQSDNVYEVPANPGEANFEVESEYLGYQRMSDICTDVFINGDVIKFKKIPQSVNYKYCFSIIGTHPNDVKESEYIVFSDTMDVTFEQITKYFFGSHLDDHNVPFEVIIPYVEGEWGITLYADNVTSKGVTLNLEQFGGSYSGTLQCGPDYYVEKYIDGVWSSVATKDGQPLIWNSIAYSIPSNCVTTWNISFEYSYGDLPQGRYRICKPVTDFVQSGQYEQKTYYAEFEIN